MKLLFILFSIVNCNHIAKNNKGKSSVVCTKYSFKVVNYSLQSNAINFNVLIELSKPYQIPRDFHFGNITSRSNFLLFCTVLQCIPH